MPVSQADTATTVASTGTYDVARFGIEGRSVRDGAPRCQPPFSAIRNLRAQIPDARVKDARRAGTLAAAGACLRSVTVR
jgi:hypothetical protein